jgi:hypothetical protein
MYYFPILEILSDIGLRKGQRDAKCFTRLSSKVQPQPIVDRFPQILPRAQIALGGLDGRVA